MESKKEYQDLIQDKNYQHRICCMYTPLAEEIRKKDEKKLEQIQNKFATAIQNYDSSLKFGFSIGGIMKSYFQKAEYNEDIIIYLLSDPTNIDSKQITFIKVQIELNNFKQLNNPKIEEIFKLLYKFNPFQEEQAINDQ